MSIILDTTFLRTDVDTNVYIFCIDIKYREERSGGCFFSANSQGGSATLPRLFAVEYAFYFNIAIKIYDALFLLFLILYNTEGEENSGNNYRHLPIFFLLN